MQIRRSLVMFSWVYLVGFGGCLRIPFSLNSVYVRNKFKRRVWAMQREKVEGMGNICVGFSMFTTQDLMKQETVQETN